VERPFALIAPAANVPRILDASNEQEESWQKMGRLFLAVVSAVDVSVPAQALAYARRMASA
jgi:hypothetical protein